MKNIPLITDTIGNTPLVQLARMSRSLPGNVAVKLESRNPLGSVKDRIAYAMIRDAEEKGILSPGGTIIEPTSGNTGIGLAFVAAARGYSLTLTMPDSMSIERRRLLAILGAELVLTPGEKGMKGAIDKAAELTESTPGAFMPQQFENPANPRVHEETTGPEIWEQTGGSVDIFVAGVGTGGTVSGVGRALKSRKKECQIIAVEPEESNVISGGTPGPHKVQGIGAGFIPKNLDRDVLDDVILLKGADAGATSRRLAKEEGILAGISAGGNVWAALELAKKPENEGKNIVTVICDTGERYLSTWLFEE